MARMIQLPTHRDDRGRLTVIDGLLPFDIQRVYYIHGSTGEPRGGHRHLKCAQGLVCVSGSCIVDWTNGREGGSATLDSPDRLLFVPPEDWHVMRAFTPDAVLVVLASEHYDPRDYIVEGYGT
jgi:dTDP-4-dehydrorhamnose 3,5-epimerase-like enzyme